MSKTILLVGCGQIGSRHLQALVCLENISEIHVVDANAQARALAEARAADVGERNTTIKLFWHERLNPAIPGGDLCLLATPAPGRLALIQRISREQGYQNFLIEKLATQSMAEYDQILTLQESLKLKIWVHCQTRLYPIFQYIKDQLKDLDDPIFFSESGGNFGLACNGIHYVDLFLFYDGSSDIIPVGAAIDPILHSSKRGPDIYDLSGILVGKTAKGGRMILDYAPDHSQSDILTILTAKRRFMVDLMHSAAWQATGSEPWLPLHVSGSIFVSHTTKAIASDILNKGLCGLPTLKECRPSHEFIFSQLQPSFDALLNRNLDYCPTT